MLIGGADIVSPPLLPQWWMTAKSSAAWIATTIAIAPPRSRLLMSLR
jgi:hypothetical protein